MSKRDESIESVLALDNRLISQQVKKIEQQSLENLLALTPGFLELASKLLDWKGQVGLSAQCHQLSNEVSEILDQINKLENLK